MDINLTDTQFFIGLLVSVILLFLGIYTYLVYKSKDISGVITLANVVIKEYGNKKTFQIIINDKIFCSYFINGSTVRTVEIEGIKYDFSYYQGEDFCYLCRTNSKGIYECKRITVNFK